MSKIDYSEYTYVEYKTFENGNIVNKYAKAKIIEHKQFTLVVECFIDDDIYILEIEKPNQNDNRKIIGCRL